MIYDSRADTLEHIRTVAGLLSVAATELLARATTHDDSKLHEPEKSVFDEYTPKLRELTYGSDEYHRARRAMKDALGHHYLENRHHPEHFTEGINDMDLFDVVEMLCDWLAATERHAHGDIWESLKHNAERFEISPQLQAILANTVRALEPEVSA